LSREIIQTKFCWQVVVDSDPMIEVVWMGLGFLTAYFSENHDTEKSCSDSENMFVLSFGVSKYHDLEFYGIHVLSLSKFLISLF